jgi:hypothetical protein
MCVYMFFGFLHVLVTVVVISTFMLATLSKLMFCNSWNNDKCI